MQPISSLSLATAILIVGVVGIMAIDGINYDNQKARNIQICIANGGTASVDNTGKLDRCEQNGSNRLKDAVKAVCDYAHNQTNGETEEACGRAQDASNTEYLCDKNGNNCWVEVK